MNTPLVYKGLTDEGKFLNLAVKEVLTAIDAALQKHGEARIGLAGGKTPKMLYGRLAQKELLWDKITWIVLDERCVPEDDPESNLGMLKHMLPKAKLLAFNVTLPALEAASQMARELINLSDIRQPLFDLLILGAGKDGHIASLFEEEIEATCNEYACPAQAKGYPTEARVTCGLLALQSSKAALLLLKGKEKQPVLDALLNLESVNTEALKLTAIKILLSRMPMTVLTDSLA